MRKQREHRQTEKGQRDKNGKPLNFSRDFESDLTFRDHTLYFGLKEHASVDTRYVFVLAISDRILMTRAGVPTAIA
jgi:hypothetical protein